MFNCLRIILVNYKDLEIWQLARDLVIDIHKNVFGETAQV